MGIGAMLMGVVQMIIMFCPVLGTYGQKLLSVALCDCLRKEIKSECTMEEIKRWHWIF